MGQGLVERTYFAPEGTLTATPLHHLYHVTDKGSDHVTLSMSTPKEFRRRITETEEFRTRIPEREYYKMTLCSMYFLPNLDSRTLLKLLAPLLAQ
jgi:hypothetical protein